MDRALLGIKDDRRDVDKSHLSAKLSCKRQSITFDFLSLSSLTQTPALSLSLSLFSCVAFSIYLSLYRRSLNNAIVLILCIPLQVIHSKIVWPEACGKDVTSIRQNITRSLQGRIEYVIHYSQESNGAVSLPTSLYLIIQLFSH